MTYGNHIKPRPRPSFIILQTGLYILLLLSLSPLTAHSGPEAQGLQLAAKSATAPFSRPGTPPIAGPGTITPLPGPGQFGPTAEAFQKGEETGLQVE